MTNRLTILRTALVTVALAAGGATMASDTASCDPMYPCYADVSTPAAVYDIAARIPNQHAPTAEGLEGELTQNRVVSRGAASPAAVYDLGVRTEDSPCQSYPCYPEQDKRDSPIAADADMTLRKADERG